MTNTELFYFLGGCLSLGEATAKDCAVTERIRRGEVDWDRIVALSGNHLVQPSLYLRFKRQGLLASLPAGLGDHLQMVHRLNLQRNQAILEQIDRINRMLAAEGIVPVYLKGAGNLLDRLYEDDGERILADIDLLVSEAEFGPAVQRLRANGYDSQAVLTEEEVSSTKHYPRLFHPSELAGVEVHRVPVDIALSANFNYTLISKELKTVATDPRCRVLSDRHKVVLNFMHGFMGADVRMTHLVSCRSLVDLLHLSHRVDVYGLLAGQVYFASKARVYSDFANHALGLPARGKPTLRSRLFVLEHDLLLNSRLLYRARWTPRFLISRIWTAYVCNVYGLIFSRQVRRSLVNRFRSPGWFSSHLNGYAESFRQNL